MHSSAVMLRSNPKGNKSVYKKRSEAAFDLNEIMQFKSRGERGGKFKNGGDFKVLTQKQEVVWPQEDKIDAKFVKIQREQALRSFRADPGVHKRCENFGISLATFNLWSKKYADDANAEKIDKLKADYLVSVLIRSGREGFQYFIINQFFAYLSENAPDAVKNIAYLRKITDLRYPHEWMVNTRKMQRRIIMHVGPTNSGKTYHALQRLQNCKNGIYCSPLRLLAYEVYDRMNKAGISCALVTGEDRRGADFSNGLVKPSGYTIDGEPCVAIKSCTIEMASMDMRDVAVVDEIQMIADRQRGWAWTNALLGLQASEIHLCGEVTAVPIVKKICAALDEDVEVREYSRLGKLHTGKKSLDNDWSRIRPGDCVVTFSRKEIFAIRNTIEQTTGLRCAVIYGGLPPEARVEQARLFNDPDSGYDVLVASDAIGMGINLSIRRIVFTTLQKFDGGSLMPISVSQTRQIGGRAGRFGSGADAGEVTAMWSKDLETLSKSINQQPPMIKAAGIIPSSEAIETFSHQFPNVPFSELWPMFRDIATVDDDYFLSSFSGQEQIAQCIEHLPLSVRDRYQLIYAPINTRDKIVALCLVKYATCVANNVECSIGSVIKLPSESPNTRDKLQVFEQWHRSITLFIWLSFHYPEIFANIEEATNLKVMCEKSIAQGLAAMKGQPGTNANGTFVKNKMNHKSDGQQAKEALDKVQHLLEKHAMPTASA
ncbi:RNA helicase [Coemansia sp. RSA 485]|nr:RNA helicase [Coemansia sp. RSA 485]